MITRIEAYRTRIEAARTIAEVEKKPDYTIYTTLPTGFYTPTQRERYLRTDGLLTRTTAEFMQEIGVQTQRLEREFRMEPRWPWGTWKFMNYSLIFGERQEFSNSKGDAKIEYNAGGFMDSEFLRVYHQSILLTPKRRHDGQVTAREAVQLLQSSEAVVSRDYMSIILFEIQEQGIRDLLTVISSNPRLDLSVLQLRG